MKVVIAIDFGTTRSGYVCMSENRQHIIFEDMWPDAPVISPKTTTELLISPEEEITAWGFTVRRKLAELNVQKVAQDYHWIRNFKMELYSGDKDENGAYLEYQNQKYYVIELISEYLRRIKDEALKKLNQTIVEQITTQDILWCLTIPAIWKDSEKDLMRRAAVEAGLIGEGDREAERLYLVLEPEAAAIYFQELEQTALIPNTKIMIVDCGGGTVDITVHRVIENSFLEELAPGTGGPFGSMYVDISFGEYLGNKLDAEILDHFYDQDPVSYLDLIDQWERMKCTFDPQTSSDLIFFPIPLKLFKFIFKHNPEILDNLATAQNGDDSNIHITLQNMKDIFRPTLDGLVSTVEEQFSKLNDNNIDIMFLAGGFSASPLLQQRLTEEFGNRVNKIVIPPNPGFAIMKGAASFGVNRSIISVRSSRLTYGVDAFSLFEEGVDPESKKFWAENIEQWICKDRFSTFVKVGEQVPLGSEIKRTYKPTISDQTVMEFKLLSTEKEKVRYADEPGVTQLGELLVEMPLTEGDFERKVEITFYFGDTEIKVKAVDQTSGNEYKTSIRFT